MEPTPPKSQKTPSPMSEANSLIERKKREEKMRSKEIENEQSHQSLNKRKYNKNHEEVKINNDVKIKVQIK
jgi:hypothetical protein